MQKADNGARTPSGGPNSATEGGSPPRASSARGPSNLTAPLQQGNHNNVEASAPESPRPSADGKTYWRYEDLERKFNTAIPRPAIPNPRKLRLVLVFKNLRQDQPSAVTCSRARLVLVFNNLRPDQPSAVTCSRARLVLVFNNLRQDQPSAITCSRASPLSYNDAANGASASKKRRFRAGATLSSDDSEAPPAKKPKRQVDGGAAPSFNGSKGSASRKRRVRDQASLSSDEPKAPPAKKHKRRAGGCATPSPVGRKVSASKETRAGGSTIVKTAAKSKRRVPGGKRARSLGKTTETKNRKLAYKRRQKLKDTYGFRSSRPRASQYKKIGGETRGRMSEFIHRELPPLSGPRALQYKKKGGKKRGSMREFIHRELPPLSDIHEIFDDMSTAAISNEEFELRETLGRLNGKTINVATMCSGTESPLLALNMCKDAFGRLHAIDIDINHLFSAEIVPYKQAYIERNFQPPSIFRDIREMANNDVASTAYGGPTQVPGNVDILIAGFPCVDFSSMNNHKKGLTDVGESRDGFLAILGYAKRFLPPIIILENVYHAPWEFIAAVWNNDRKKMQEMLLRGNKRKKSDSKGLDDARAARIQAESYWESDKQVYVAVWIKVDTKNYYIPQTRNRGYLCCFLVEPFDSPKAAQAAVLQWAQMFRALGRPTSESVEAFVLPNDDPRLHRMMDEMARRKKPKREVDWEICRGRHERYRDTKGLGTKRPVTQWVDGGSCKAPEYIFHSWLHGQVERIWDFLDTATLRSASRGYDPSFKPRVWEISQNVDRYTDTNHVGIAGCVTPSGLPYLTTRGGPITGLELIGFQGLPIDDLSLTTESQRELSDLAGNAMTSTVVGAAILSAIATGSRCLMDSVQRHEGEKHLRKVRTSPLQITPMNHKYLHHQLVLDLGASDDIPIARLRELALTSVYICKCEGQTLAQRMQLLVCQDCNHQVCTGCAADTPKHNYKSLVFNERRFNPETFLRVVIRTLPMRLEIRIFSQKDWDELKAKVKEMKLPEKEWELLEDCMMNVLGQEHRYQSAKRSFSWKITYDAAFSKLELHFVNNNAYWLLFAKPLRSDPVNSHVRELLKYPIARMSVGFDNVLEGSWEFCLPVHHKFSISITSCGGSADSWEKNFGLESKKYIDKKVPTTLEISGPRFPDAGILEDTLARPIQGLYDLCNDCDAASASLYKKRRGQDEDDILPLFLFLDPERARSEAHDGFVFSTNVNRLNYGDTRDTIAKIHPEWKPDHQLGKGTLTRDGAAHGTWIKFNARLEEKKIYKPVTYAFPRFTALEAPIPVFKRISPAPSSTPLGPTPFDCMNAVITLLACKVPSTMVDGKYWKSDEWTQINLRNERHFAMAFSWLIARAKDCPDVSLKWKKLALPKKFHRCTICAPEPPKIKWKLKPTKVAKIAPYEDVHEAAVFERAMKARPAPFVIRTRVDEEANGRVCVGFNLATLAHRALERFTDPTGVNGKGGMRLSWRIDSEWDLPSSALPKFSATLENNKDSEEAHHIFPGTNMALRPEQRRSLHWMISQEAPVPTPFFEAEIEEAILPHLGWRVEVKAEKSRQIRGGVSADKVGYGKTVTTLALIDHQMKPAENHAKQSLEGCIPVKATLIAVPNTLVSQWEDESKRFLGSSYNILIIPDNKKHPTIKEIMEAHIIIISWNVFGQPSYQKKLSDFAALPEGPPAGGRQHEVFLKRALASIKTHTEELKNTNPGVLADDLDRRLQEARDDVELVFDVPSKRLTGAKYAAEARNATAKGLLSQTKPKTDAEPKAEASHFKYMRVKHGMKAVPVHVWHMFSFYRIVVDEYTYVDGKQYATLTSLHTVCRWALSGTPPLDDFNDIRRLAGFLAINLGDEDDDPVSASDNSIGNSRARRTDAENFRALGSIHTQDWHIGRHAHAQAFLDQFVRQNVAEISELSSSTHLCTVFLHQPEILINLELQIQLQQTDMHIVLASQKKKAGDRYKRINELLRGCGSAEEALLKCCSYFDVPATQNNGTTAVADICEDLIRTRRLDYEDHENVCRMQLEHMTWLRKQIQRSCSRKISDVHYNVWKRHLEKHGVGDPRVSNFLVEVIQDAQARAESEQYNFPLREFYRPKPTAVEEKEELLMDKKRKEQEKRQRKTERQMRARLEKDTRTHDANAVIWKKEDIQKKLETDRKVKKAKKAKKAREDSDREMEENSDTESDEEVPQPMSQQEVIPAKDLRDIEIPQNDFLRYEQASRSGTAELRRLTTEFVARSRAYRFIEAAHMLQKEAGNDVTGECDACHREISVSGRKLRLNILCGHLICDECGKDIECSVDGCKSNAEEYRMRNAEQLRGNSDRSLRFGSKVDAIIRTIEDQDDDDQFLLFIQFEDLISKIAGALTEAGITNYAIKTTSGIQGVADMRDFQTNINNSGENRKKRVLILNSSNQSAAGANLFNANHVILLSPPMTGTQHAYDASLEQCIGRALRYGQTKAVHIYRFLALHTYDVDVIQNRERKTLVRGKVDPSYTPFGYTAPAVGADGGWSLVAEDGVGAEMEAGWASGV